MKGRREITQFRRGKGRGGRRGGYGERKESGARGRAVMMGALTLPKRVCERSMVSLAFRGARRSLFAFHAE